MNPLDFSDSAPNLFQRESLVRMALEICYDVPLEVRTASSFVERILANWQPCSPRGAISIKNIKRAS